MLMSLAGDGMSAKNVGTNDADGRCGHLGRLMTFLSGFDSRIRNHKVLDKLFLKYRIVFERVEEQRR
ncbi:MAG: hypothetical protein D6732_02905 [Methanobacteriota archaeon]|nr:MAG: hypothetical protein D6732_02905 [Euryarchaeota archaeon]